MSKLTKQYQQIKAKYADAVLLFRVGDFYEALGEDAKVLSKEMEIALVESGENKGPGPVASLPFHSLDAALHKLVKKGYKVAVCEELEDPKTAKGLLKRGITDLL